MDDLLTSALLLHQGADLYFHSDIVPVLKLYIATIKKFLDFVRSKLWFIHQNTILFISFH